jgi:hypothetical protein
MHIRWKQTLAAVAVLAAAGCAQEVISQRENMLAAAGFRVQPANTPERLQSLQALPPNRFVLQDMNGRQVWVYADPVLCKCLYVGAPENYQAYHQLAFQQRLADQQLEAAQLTYSGFGWGPWGPWGY